MAENKDHLWKQPEEATEKIEDLVKGGVPEPLFRAIRKRVMGSAYKRRMPVVLKISSRTVSMEYRLPRDTET